MIFYLDILVLIYLVNLGQVYLNILIMFYHDILSFIYLDILVLFNLVEEHLNIQVKLAKYPGRISRKKITRISR